MEQQQLNISLDKTTGVSCEQCSNNIFQEGVMLRKASRFITGTAQDALIPIPVFVCNKCGDILKETLPMQLRTDYAEVIEEENDPKIIQMK